MERKHMTIKILSEKDLSGDVNNFVMWKPREDQHFVVVKSKGWTLQEAENDPVILEEEKEYIIKKNQNYSFTQGRGPLVFGVLQGE